MSITMQVALTRIWQCSQYCEVKLTWFYGKEVPFANAGCSATDDSCAISNSFSASVSNSFTFNVGFSVGNKRELSSRDGNPAPEKPGLAAIKASFNVGASWQWSDTSTSTTATSNVKPKNADGQCGYWTFVPYYVT